jgi:hypothetical protein
MNKAYLENFREALYDSHRVTAEMMVVAVAGDPEKFDVLYGMAFSESYPLNMRAANVCRLCCEQHSELILPYLDELPHRIVNHPTDGVKRSFLKIYADCLDEKQFSNLDQLAEVVFMLVNDVKQAIAVRAYCLDIAVKLCRLEPDLMNEVYEIARFELNSPHGGMQAKARMVIDRIIKKSKTE